MRNDPDMNFADKAFKINQINRKKSQNYWMENVNHYNKEFESVFKKSQIDIVKLQNKYLRGSAFSLGVRS